MNDDNINERAIEELTDKLFGFIAGLQESDLSDRNIAALRPHLKGIIARHQQPQQPPVKGVTVESWVFKTRVDLYNLTTLSCNQIDECAPVLIKSVTQIIQSTRAESAALIDKARAEGLIEGMERAAMEIQDLVDVDCIDDSCQDCLQIRHFAELIRGVAKLIKSGAICSEADKLKGV